MGQEGLSVRHASVQHGMQLRWHPRTQAAECVCRECCWGTRQQPHRRGQPFEGGRSGVLELLVPEVGVQRQRGRQRRRRRWRQPRVVRHVVVVKSAARHGDRELRPWLACAETQSTAGLRNAACSGLLMS